jgi:hypothetical protein
MRNILLMFMVLVCTSFESKTVVFKEKNRLPFDELAIYRMRDNRLKATQQKKINEIIETQYKIIELK